MSDLTLEDDEPTVQKKSDAAETHSPQQPQAPKDDSAPRRKSATLTPIMYRGQIGEVVKIVLGNVLLNIPTFGIYSFWGKTRMRKYVASCISVANDPLEYLGTGKELFIGFLKVLPIMILLLVSYLYFMGKESPLVLIPAFIFIYLIQVAVFAATRYRFSRTSWRGIRGYVEGSAFSYANYAVWRMFLNIITLFILVPSSDMKLHKHIMDRSYFGTVMASFDTNAGKGLLGTHILTLLLAPFTLGISRLWYHAAVKRAKMNGLTIEDIGFQCSVTGGSLFVLILKNMLTVMGLLAIPGIIGMVLVGGAMMNIMGTIQPDANGGVDFDPSSMQSPMIVVGTLGIMVLYFIALHIAKAINTNRGIGFMCFHIFLKGDLDTTKVLQAERQKTPMGGEGLDDIMGLDSGLI